MHEERWSDAAALLRAHRARQETPEGLYREATCLFQTGETGDARRLLERAVELRPERTLYLRTLGLLEAQQGNPAAAREHWHRGLRSHPHHPDLRDLIARYAADGT